jgi:3-phenylpropionate/cinnamic acid dioxygenase small subunit
MDSERLRCLDDKQALHELLVSYAWACDDRDWARYRSVFTDDATIDYTGAFGRSGRRDEIAAWIEELMGGPTLEHTQHMLSNFYVELDGDRAAGRVNYLNPDVFSRPEGRSLLVNGGIYRFEAVRTDAGWRLSSLTARILWSAKGEILTAPLG